MNQPLDPQRLTELLSSAANDVPTGDDAMTRIGQGIDRRRRFNQTLAIGGTSLAVVAVLVFAFILRPNATSSSTPPPVAQSSTPTPRPSPAPSTSPAAQTLTHLLPKGFTVRSVSSLGQAWWILGDSSVEFTTDGGRTFETRPVPPGWRSFATGDASGAGVAFVDVAHGILWAKSQTWVTDDGGTSWRQSRAIAGTVVATAHTRDSVSLLVAGSCRPSQPPVCAAALTTYTAAGGLVDHRLPLSTSGEQARSISIAGGTIFVLALDGSGAPGHLLRSNDNGATFTSLANGQGCLTGTLDAYSDLGVYEICVSGTMAHLMRSTDGGKTFSAVNVHTTTGSGMGNCASIVTKDVDTSVLSPGDGLIRTNDGFRTSSPVAPPVPGNCAQLLEGATPDQMFAIENATSGVQLWVSSDAGQTWRQVLRAQ